MKKARLRILGVAGVIVLVPVSALCWPRKQPAYHGHPLEYWLHELPLMVVPPTGPVTPNSFTIIPRAGPGIPREKPGLALEAMQAVGTNGLPFLMKKLSRREPSHANQLQVLALKVGYKHLLFANLQAERAQAATALISLGPLPPNTLTELRQLGSSFTNSPVGQYAALVTAISSNARLRGAVIRSCQ